MNVLIVDDEPLIRQGLAYLLSNFEGVNVIGQAGNGSEALSMCKDYPVEVVLMDMRMPVMDGCTATRLIKEAYPNINILVLTTFKDDQYIGDAVKYGASGYLLKDSSPSLIHDSLKNICSGGFVVDSNLIKGVLADKKPKIDPKQFDLSEREVAIIELMADGFSNKEIGNQLFLTEGTVKNNVTQLLNKLDLKDRTQIVAFAFRHGLVQ